MFEDLSPWEIQPEPSSLHIHLKPKRSLLRHSTPQRTSFLNPPLHHIRHSHHPSNPLHTFHYPKDVKDKNISRSLEAENNHKFRMATLRKHHHRRSMIVCEESVKLDLTLKDVDNLRRQGLREKRREKQKKVIMHGKETYKKYCNAGLLNTVRNSQTPESYNCYLYPTNKSYFCFNRHFI